MKFVFWLLNINPKVDDDRVELWLWGIDQKGNRVMLVEHNFAAYFYVVLHGGANPDAVAQEIMRESAGEVAKTKVVRRRFFGKPVIAIKITCKNPIKTAQVAKELRKLDCVSLPRR